MQWRAKDIPGTGEGLLRPTQRRPWLTWITCVACLAIFLGVRFDSAQTQDLAMVHWGWRPPGGIYSGAYWALITSVFVHVDFWHLSFNVYWLYFLGRTLERTIGWWRWLAFVVGAAVVSSGLGLAVSGDPVIGMSGVACALFGFMWVGRKQVRTYARLLTTRTAIIFLMWLVVGVVLTLSRFWAFGIAAQCAGLLYGGALAAWVQRRPSRLLMAPAIAVLVAGALVPLFWAPWLFSWTSWCALRAEQKGDLPAALQWYERSRDRAEDNVWCLYKIALLRGRMGDLPGFQEALATLRETEPRAAQEVEQIFRQARGGAGADPNQNE